MKIMSGSRAAAAMAGALVLAQPVPAHHGFGRFDRSQEVEIAGVITGIDFVNPHAYLYFDADDANGGTLAMRCEMRAATLMRRGSTATISSRPVSSTSRTGRCGRPAASRTLPVTGPRSST